MKRTFNVLTAITALLALSGCMALDGESGYHNDRGDKVSGDGTVRYVGWCNVHQRDSGCGQSTGTLSASTAARPSSVPDD